MRTIRRAGLAVALGLAVLGAAERAAATQGPVAAAPRAFEGFELPPTGGRLEGREGGRVLHLAGGLRERGFAEGYLCAAELLACFEEFALGHVVAGHPKAWDLVIRSAVAKRFVTPDSTQEWAAAVVVGVRAAAAERGGRAWLEALGRELCAEDIVACAAIPDLAGFLCSSFAAFGDLTATGDVLVGRNLDYASTPAMERHSLVAVHAPLGDRAGWVGVGWPGSPGCLTGLSDRGVFVAIHDVDGPLPRGEGRFTPRVIALQELVETLTPSAATAEDALRLLRARRYAMGGNVMLAWQSRPDASSRGVAVLELDGAQGRDTGVTLRTPTLGATWIACSNHHRLRCDEGHGCSRYRTLSRGAAAGALDGPAAWELIRAASMRNTLYRCVADLGEGTLGVERHTDAGWQPRVELELAPLVQAETQVPRAR